MKLNHLTFLSLLFITQVSSAGTNDWFYECTGEDSEQNKIIFNSVRVEDSQYNERDFSFVNKQASNKNFSRIEKRGTLKNSKAELETYVSGSLVQFKWDLSEPPSQWPDDELPEKSNSTLEMKIYSGLNSKTKLLSENRYKLKCFTRSGGE